MIELKDWIEQTNFPNKPWLVLGKGPTFAKISEIDLSNYNTLSLNHALREQKVNVAHIIDIDVVEACAKQLTENCDWLIMPRIPHVRGFASGYLQLSHWLECIPVLQTLERQGKLVTYTFSHEGVSHEPAENNTWTISAKYFSSEAALEILAKMSVKTIRSLGIDGGRNYSEAFEDLQRESLLVNGQPSFDLQFPQLDAIACKYKIDFQPLYQSDDDKNSERADCRGALHAPAISSLATKIQEMEQDLRDTRAELEKTAEQLAIISKDYGICSERLGWARDEIKEYREQILKLERNIHSLYKSKTWKLGRTFTKPAELVRKKLFK